MKTSELTNEQMNALNEVAQMRGTFEQQVALTVLKTGNMTYDQANIINPCFDEELRVKVSVTDVLINNIHSASSMRQRPSSMRY